MISVDWTQMEAVAKQLVAGWQGDGPGGAIVGFDQSGIRFAAAAGLADLSQGSAYTADTVVRLASITKHIFGTMVLMHPQTITPDEKIGEITAGLPPEFAALSVAQALNMTGGLPDTREALVLHGLSANALIDEASTIAYSAALAQLNYTAGHELSYTNLGYRFLEWGLRRRGLSFTRFVEDHLRGEKGHVLHAPVYWGDAVDGLVPGYWFDKEMGWQPGFQGMPLAAAGNVCGSAIGLANWLRDLTAGKGDLAGIWQKLQISGVLAGGRETGYGLGLATGTVGGRKVHGHGGSQAGYKAHFLIDDETGIGVVITSNREDTLAATLARRCFEAAFHLSPPQALPEDWAPDGFYYQPDTGRWAELRGSSIFQLSAGEQLVAGPDGSAVSTSVTSPFALRYQDGALVGEIGHAPVRLEPASGQADAGKLTGQWEAPEFGASFEIKDGILIQGVGPARLAAKLQPIADHLWLYDTGSKLWPARVALRLLPDGRLQLSTARARNVFYQRRA